MGRTVTQAFMNATGPQDQINWYTMPASAFPNGQADMPEKIVDERAWAIVASAF
jgi:hypothetical protein